MANRARDESRREQAYQDMKALPTVGKKANPNGLYDWYQERMAMNPEERALIPTLSRGVIYNWSRDGDWMNRLADELKHEKDVEGQEFSLLRKRVLGQLYAFAGDAVLALHQVAKHGESERSRVDAAKAILDRVGLVAQVAVRTSADDKPTHPRDEPSLIDEETAEEVELLDFIRTAGSNRNG